MQIQFEPNERLVVAMSGGVDSSVCASMLHEAGHELVGLFMRNGVEVAESEVRKKSCCSLGDARDARMLAASMGIPFQAVDLADEFGDIIDYFVAEYSEGRTPNPCAVCNRDLKMGRLLDFADELGAAGVATGHYARLALEDGRVRLRRGMDRHKDQSYQLFSVSEEHLARTVLPLGELQKSEVREMAAARGMRTSAKADSQEVCFIPSNDYRQLLAERGVELHPGDIVNTVGRKLGTHTGTENFTIGQRRGHGIASTAPLYVVELIPEDGVVVLGPKEDCMSKEMIVSDLNWVGFDVPPSGEFRCEVQFRYHCIPAPASVHVDGDSCHVVFDRAQMAVAPGQGSAFYREDLLLGGGWIERDRVGSGATGDVEDKANSIAAKSSSNASRPSSDATED
ncbi:MAG: tRNA-specific 2-thiouridylase [Planctomycetota bacterium]|jgi:tRNA-specific 2-thiouridylase